MPDIFDEVEEDLRADRARRLLIRYGVWLIAAAVAIVLAVAGVEVWRWYDAKRAGRVATAYVAAAQAAESHAPAALETAQAGFAKVAREGGAGYRSVARLRQAALLAGHGDVAGANALWDQVAGDPSADPLLRDLANLQWALHSIDGGDPAAVAGRLRPLAAQNNAWHGLAMEGQALLALRQGHVDEARDTLSLLVQDTGAPEGVRRRASGLLEQLGPKAGSAS